MRNRRRFQILQRLIFFVKQVSSDILNILKDFLVDNKMPIRDCWTAFYSGNNGEMKTDFEIKLYSNVDQDGYFRIRYSNFEN